VGTPLVNLRGILLGVPEWVNPKTDEVLKEWKLKNTMF